MDVKTFGVIGAGTMGNGIAQVAATSGFDVLLNDVSGEYLERARKKSGRAWRSCRKKADWLKMRSFPNDTRRV